MDKNKKIIVAILLLLLIAAAVLYYVFTSKNMKTTDAYQSDAYVTVNLSSHKIKYSFLVNGIEIEEAKSDANDNATSAPINKYVKNGTNLINIKIKNVDNSSSDASFHVEIVEYKKGDIVVSGGGSANSNAFVQYDWKEGDTEINKEFTLPQPAATTGSTPPTTSTTSTSPVASSTQTLPETSATPTESTTQTVSNTPAPTQDVSKTESTPSSTPNPPATAPAEPGNEGLAYPGYAIKYDTNKYDENVLNVQKRLIYLGYTLKTDGYFGPQTLNAIKEFQKDYELYQTGILDEQNWIILFNGIKH
jgi:hypothetical protein